MAKNIISSLLLVACLSLYAQEKPKIDKKELFAQSEGNSQLIKAIKKGDSYYKKGLYDAALEQYMLLYSVRDDYSPLNYKIGVSHLYGIYPNRALPFFNQADSAVAADYYCQKGIALIYHQQYEEAKEAFEQYAATLMPKQSEKMKDKINRYIAICDFSVTAVQDSLPVFIINAGPNVNSYYDDYSAVELLSPSPSMYFTSRRPKDNQTNIASRSVSRERILYAAEFANGEASEVKDSRLKSFKHLSVAGVDNNTGSLLYYKGSGDVYRTQFKENGKTTKNKRLKKMLNNRISTEGSVSFTDNGDAYFISDRLDGIGGKDIWFAPKKKENSFYRPQNLFRLNTPFDEECVFVTPDGNTLYFSTNGLPGMGGFDIYQSVMMPDGTWSDPVNMGYPINSPDDDLYYRLTSDTTLALFSSRRNGGFGGLDVYYAKKDLRIPFELSGNVVDAKTGRTLPATVKMMDRTTGMSVATTTNDTIQQSYLLEVEDVGDYYLLVEATGYHPATDSFINPVKRHDKLHYVFELEKLLFPYTLGGYVSDVRTDNPVFAEILIKKGNVSYRTVSDVNTGFYSVKVEDKDNFDLLVKAAGYFDFNESLPLKNIAEDSGNKNITLQRSVNTYIMTGVVIGESNAEPLKANIRATKANDKNFIQTTVTNENGKYDLILSDMGPFLIEVTSEGYFFANSALQFKKDSMLVIRNFTLQKMESGAKMVIENILFNTGKASLRSESSASLNKLVTLLQENPDVKIEVSGHTDNVGSATTNKTLSKNRALSVRNYLISKGIAKERVNYEGYGFERPIAPNDTEKGRAANRRVEVEILK